MGHRQVDPAGSRPLRPRQHPAGEPDVRLGPSGDLHVAPRERASDPEAERLADRFLTGEARRVVLRRVWAGVAVRLLRVREAPVAEARISLERASDPFDLDQVGADGHAVDSRNEGTSAIESSTTSGDTLQAPASSRNFPVRTRIVRIPSAAAPPMSASTSSPTIHVRSGSASSAASAASKYSALGFPSTVAARPVAYSSPATKAPASRSAPRAVCHHGF